MGDITGKVWGNTMEIINNDGFGFHRIFIKKGGYCSKHKHNFKTNMFYCESGLLKIKVWKNEYELIDETILEAGDQTKVKPGEHHQFEALKDTVAFEIYYLESLNDKDIDRESVGGQK